MLFNVMLSWMDRLVKLYGIKFGPGHQAENWDEMGLDKVIPKRLGRGGECLYYHLAVISVHVFLDWSACSHFLMKLSCFTGQDLYY